MHNKNNEDLILEDSTETYENELIEETVCEVTGVVNNCHKLNVRERPDKNSEVVTIVNCLEKLTIYLDASTDNWYSVKTNSGIKGFCMKKYVSIIE